MAYSLVVVGMMCNQPIQAAQFVDVTTASGITHVQHQIGTEFKMQPYMTGGAAAGDFDNDGWVDLYVTRLDGSDILYRNLGATSPGQFQDVTTTAFGSNHLGSVRTNAPAWGDIDNDGDLDLYITAIESDRHYLYINDGSGAFSESAVSRGVSLTEHTGLKYGQSATFGDYDLDGYLDLHVTEWRMTHNNPTGASQHNRLFRNLGTANPGSFEDATNAAGVATDHLVPEADSFQSQGFASRFADVDRDGHVDLLMASDHGTSRLFWGKGDGTFLDGTDAAGVGTEHFGMGSTLADYDNDGDLDWFVTSIYGTNGDAPQDGNRLYQNQRNRTFLDVTDQAGVRDAQWGWGAAFFDYDHDGDQDLVAANGQYFPFDPGASAQFENNRTAFWENNGHGAFTENGLTLGITDTRQGKGLLTFDYDNDGDLDLFIVNNGDQPVLYENVGGNDGDWLIIEAVGTIDNRQGIGALIEITPDLTNPTESMIRQIDGGSHFLGQSQAIAHFGLGATPTSIIDRVRITWPNGDTNEIFDVAPNQVLALAQTLAGDCNEDGYVGIDDLNIVLAHWNQSVTTGELLMGDASGDGYVGIEDLNTVLANWNAGSLPSNLSPIPEPGSVATLGFGALLSLRLRRPNHKSVL